MPWMHRHGRLTVCCAIFLATASCAAQGAKISAPPPAAISNAPPPSALDSAQHINAAGLAIIRDFEGLNLTAYQDRDQWLIGYGNASHASSGKTITREEAEAYLKEDIALCESKVSDALTHSASANAFSAMVSLCYNIGWQAFTGSTVVKRFNASDNTGAADAFLNWSKATVDGQKVVVQRLLDRRKRERELFLTPDASA